VIYSISTSLLVTAIDPTLTETNLQTTHLIQTFIVTVIFGPIAETIVFQFLLIEGLLALRLRIGFVITIAAVLFAATHHYNWVYVVVMLFSGLAYGYYYWLLRRWSITEAFLWVLLLHASWNFIAFLNNDVLEWF